MKSAPSRLKASAVLVAATAALLAGCSTPENPGTGAVNTGTYPNLNIKPGIAADQFTPAERAAKANEVKASQTGAVRSGGATPANEQAGLAALGRTHAKKTLDEIEKDCSPRPNCS